MSWNRRLVRAMQATACATLATAVVASSAAAAGRDHARFQQGSDRQCGVIWYHHMRFPNFICLHLRFEASGTVVATEPQALVVSLAGGGYVALNVGNGATIHNDQGQVEPLSAVAVGDTVHAPYNVTPSGDTTRVIEYLAPNTTPPPPPAPPYRVRGLVTGDSNGTLQVTTAMGNQITVDLGSATKLTSRSGSGTLQSGDFILAEVQQGPTGINGLNVIFDTVPFWVSSHRYAGTVTATSNAGGTLQVTGGPSYPFVLDNNAVVVDPSGAPTTLSSGVSVRMKAALFRGTLYAVFVAETNAQSQNQ